MGRRSINGHSRRRKNKSSALKKTEASPLKSVLEDNKHAIIGAVATGGVGGALIGTAIDRSKERNEIEEKTGRKFNRLRAARQYEKGGAEDDSAWQAILEDLEDTSRLDPPSAQL